HHKGGSAGDRPVHVRLGSEVDHQLMAGDDGLQQRRVADVTADEVQPGTARDGFEVRHGARVGELVQDGHAGILEAAIAARQHRADVVRADESGAAGYQDLHELICTLLWSPRIRRCALGTLGAGVTSTSCPMSDASIRRTPSIDAPRSTIEYSISLSTMAQPS